MKHLIIPFCAIAFFIPSISHAQETVVTAEAVATSTAEVEAPALLPGSPLYFLKGLKERTQMLFTFSKEKKVERAAAFAEVRQKEYEALRKEGKIELAEKVQQRKEELLQKVQERIELIREKNPEAAEKIEQALEHRREVLERNLEKVPDAARKGIERALQAPLNEGEARMRVRPVGDGESSGRTMKGSSEFRHEMEERKATSSVLRGARTLPQ